MSLTIPEPIIKKIITKLIKSEDYRIEILTILNAEFLQECIEFFKQVVDAKLRNEEITIDWYKEEFINPKKLSADEIIINSGLNKKTIINMYNTAKKEIVLEASFQHYEQLKETINYLIEEGEDIDIELTLTFRNVSVKLNINETLIVINRLAVKRASFRGSLWSTIGKKVENPLMITLCNLFQIPDKYYNLKTVLESLREVDFYLIDGNGQLKRCEVKLMGKGNPENIDAVFARETHIFIADKILENNKLQLNQANIYWLELRNQDRFNKFYSILQSLQIPYQEFDGDLDKKLEDIFTNIF
jgi:hypothetical protein